MRNMNNFLVADTGLGVSGIYRFDASSSTYSIMIVASGYNVVKIKHLEEMNWIGVSE